MKTKTSSKRQPAKKSSTTKLWNQVKPWQKVTGSVVVLVFAVTLFALVPQTHSAASAPVPSGAVVTPYGSIGKWMLQSDGSVSNYGGQLYQNKTLLEVVNAIIVDPTSKTAAASTTKLNSDMTAAGFGTQFGHSTGFSGVINNTTYAQQPTGWLSAFSDNYFWTQNNHGRLFGPAPATGGGYVYSGALSTETPGFYGWTYTHLYVSSNTARNALAHDLVASGQIQAASINMNNTYNTTDTTTGDHDGNAVVIVLK